MSTSWHVVYDDARARICKLVTALSAQQLASRVPATPEWTARELFAHVVGVASDAVTGRTDGRPGPSWTAPQVSQRQEYTLDDIADEWADVAPAVCSGLFERRIHSIIVQDVLTHEADLREAFGREQLPGEAIDAALDGLMPLALRKAEGDGTLIVHAGEREWRRGDGEPLSSLTVAPYELYRGMMSRRSRTQMQGWGWTGPARTYLETLPVFGPRDDDQPSG